MKLELLRKTDLAVQALRRLALNASRVQGPVLAAEISTTSQFLGQVMSPLVRAGWVHSGRGPTGGYELVVSLDDVSMADAIEAVEGPIDNGICALRGGPCAGSEHCAIHLPWRQARAVMHEQLSAISLNDPVAFPEISAISSTKEQ